MKELKIPVEDLLRTDQKLIFLVGAGCSVDPPSCLPAGRQMMEELIKYTCAEPEIEKIIGLKELRFEMLVEIIRDTLDEDLKLIDYYGQCDKSNLQHFFLAEMIQKGQYVLTTNFDCLIEHALLQLGFSKDQILPVITKNDYEKYSDPYDLIKKGKKPVYKIHGSTKNILTGEDTKTYLIATIQAFGSNKEGLNVFQVEPFKRPLFENISKGRSLVVMGYSGSDDFDIIPTLKILKRLEKIIWINHLHDGSGIEKIYEIESADRKKLDTSDKINQILIELKQKQVAPIYRVDINTLKLCNKLREKKYKLSLSNFSLNPTIWLKNNIKTPSEIPPKILKFYIPYVIYAKLDKYNDSLRCLENIFTIAEKLNDQKWKCITLNYFGMIYSNQGNYPEALKRFDEALKIAEQLDDLYMKASVLNNIGALYSNQGNYPEAIKRYDETLKIAEQLDELPMKATLLSNIGLIYSRQGNYSEALKRYEQALKIAEKLGDLSRKATYLANIGLLYSNQGNLLAAIKRYDEALQIAEQLSDLSMKATLLNNIGLLRQDNGDDRDALIQYEEALKIDEQLGALSGKATRLSNIAGIYADQGNYPEALKRYEQALELAEQLEDLPTKAALLNNIGSLYTDQDNYPEALKRYEQALELAEQLEDLPTKAALLNNIGLLYENQGNYPEALKRYEQGLKIAEQLGDLSKKSDILFGKATVLKKIGVHYEAQGNYPEALKQYNEALILLNQLEPFDSEEADLVESIKENIQKIKRMPK